MVMGRRTGLAGLAQVRLSPWDVIRSVAILQIVFVGTWGKRHLDMTKASAQGPINKVALSSKLARPPINL